MLDGCVSRRVNKYITAAIMDIKLDSSLSPSGKETALSRTSESYKFITTPFLEQQVERVGAHVLPAISKYDLDAFELTIVNGGFFRSHKCSPKPEMQLATQLA